MKIRTSRIYRRDEGVALIFALAMLALLLIMLIGFLSTRILDRRIAYANKDASGARFLARGVMARVKTQLENVGESTIYIRQRSSDSKVIVPLVSVNDESTALNQHTSDKVTDAGNGYKFDAYKSLKPLLRKYFGPYDDTVSRDKIRKDWYWPNVFPEGIKADYPEWIYYYNNETKDRMTGRIAYIILPNLGINPAELGNLSGTATAENPANLGKSYRELQAGAFIADAALGSLQTYRNWLSMDILLGKKGLHQNSNFKLSEVGQYFYAQYFGGVDSENRTLPTTDQNRGFSEFANLYFTAHQQQASADDRKYVDLASTDHSYWKGLLDEVSFDGDSAQVAANIVDYNDADNEPTLPEGVTNSGLDTAVDAPVYMGIEKTPYINQIAPIIGFTGDYSYTTTPVKDNPANITVSQNLTISYQFGLMAELINIYETALPSGKIVLKDFKMTATVELTQGGNPVTTGWPQTITIEKDSLEVSNTGDVGANSYLAIRVNDIVPKTSLPIYTYTEEIAENPGNISEIKATIKINKIGFSKVLFKSNVKAKDNTTKELNVDYICGRKFDIAENKAIDFEITQPYTPLPTDPNDPNYSDQNETINQQMEAQQWTFGKLEGTTKAVIKNVSSYTSFEVEDPRCNLHSFDAWEPDSGYSYVELNDLKVANEGAKNDNADASNDSITAEKDLENVENGDPALGLSTAIIRDKPMESPWELGLIHRGTPWQTIGLSNALSKLDSGFAEKLTYKNDAFLFEKWKFEDGKIFEFNINYPYSQRGALLALTKGMKYSNPSNTLENTNFPLGDTALFADTAREEELRKWLSYKCYDAGGSDPGANSAKVYQRYMHRGMVASVIRDWLINGSKSPLKADNKLNDARIEEFVAKIVPLVRCGENYEYFTVFAVAQSIKDVSGTVYSYDANGTLKNKACKLAKDADDKSNPFECDFDNDGNVSAFYDKITGEVFFVARIRREKVSCKDTSSCRQGLHHKDCRFKVKVLEQYTLSDLD